MEYGGGVIFSDDEWSNDSSLHYFLSLLEGAEVEDAATSRREYVDRDREEAHRTLMKDYFDNSPVHNAQKFHDRYRLTKRLFLEIVATIESRYEWFQEGWDGRGKKGFTCLQKCFSVLKQLASGNPPDELDDYMKMAERTSRECLDGFCYAVVQIYRKEFLRRPTTHDIALLHQAHEERHHIPEMLGSIDCTHLNWRNCPRELRGQYKRGDHQYPTIMLEAVASQDLWVWHAFFGAPGSNNDINVQNSSPLFLTERNRTAAKCPFMVNGRTYKRGYYLVDGGYPNWASFVKAYTYPNEPKEKKFKKLQESARKDVERCFGVLKARWGILNRPLRPFSLEKIKNIVYACLILHNMLIKEDGNAISPIHVRDPPVEPIDDEEAFQELRDEHTNIRLRFDLTKHVASQQLAYLDED